MSNKTKDKAESPPPRISVYYERGRHYRTVHADGVWVGLTPAAKLQFAFFNELRPLPEFVVHEVTNDGGLGAQVEQVVKDGLVRENEVNVVMDVGMAIQFIALLQQAVTQVQTLQQARINKPKGGE